MPTSILRSLAAGLVLFAVAGCDPAMMQQAGLAPAPVATVQAPVPVDNGVYVARQDGTFTIPAIPLEKLPPEYQRQTVAYPTAEAPGTVIINPAERHLYLITGPNEATRYGIAVGKAGFEWSGVANVVGRKPWPTWTPPPEMIERRPELAKWAAGQPGGPTNPLGARAIYLKTNGVDYGYRIHGTPEWQSIGHNASSGCIRMINQDVIDLYSRVPDGAKVIVLTASGQVPTGLSLPPPPKKKAVKTGPPKPAQRPDPVPASLPALPTALPPPVLTSPVVPVADVPVGGRV